MEALPTGAPLSDAPPEPKPYVRRPLDAGAGLKGPWDPASVVKVAKEQLVEGSLLKDDPATAEAVREIRDAQLRKLDAENSVAALATLLAGFAMSIIPGYSSVESPEDCKCGLLGVGAMATLIAVCEYVHVLGLGLVAVLASLSVVQTATHYFEGVKLLSSRAMTLEASVAEYTLTNGSTETNITTSG